MAEKIFRQCLKPQLFGGWRKGRKQTQKAQDIGTITILDEQQF